MLAEQDISRETDAAAESGRDLSAFSRLRAILGGSVGNLVEYYDWFAYTASALYFAQAFFPAGDQTVQLLNVAAVFAVGFLMRPIGGWVMGVYADRAGRRAALTLSMLLMGLGSLVIALTPGYAEIGIWAPVILLLSRMLQGLSVGGEYGASATYMSEVAGRHRRGFWASFHYVTLVAGQVLGVIVLVLLQFVMTDQELHDWGWRVPFFIGAVCALLALWIRRGIPETRSFEAVRRSGPREPAWRTLSRHPKEVGIVLGITMAGSLGFYTFTTYMQKYLANSAGFSKDAATQISALSLVAFMLMQPLVGYLSDVIGRRTLLIVFATGTMLLTYPLMSAIGATQSPAIALLLAICGLALIAPYTAISGLFKAELFPSEVRALGVGFPYAVANAVFGGTAEFVALYFKRAGHEHWYFFYVSAVMLVALTTALLMRDTKRFSRILED